MHIRSLIFASLSAIALACQSPAHAMAPAQSVPNAAPATPAVASAPAGSPDFATIAQRILPSVVSIHVQQQATQSSSEGGPNFGEPGWFFHSFPGFGQQFQAPQQGPREGLGSGFVIDSSGLILTNYHVVDGADQIEVTVGTPEGPQQTVSAKVVGKAPDFDVALIRTEHKLDVPALGFGDSDKLRVGEWVMAIGNPFGLSQSMSVGIISGKHREDLNPSGHQGI
ncbi:MAG TPA: trypsin-like peptidase domain-containing protein, partial [Polyangiaceae bacterium]|nr:trypsin-like peptidase domain-containing protein [Polyangiaceae bacterium]